MTDELVVSPSKRSSSKPESSNASIWSSDWSLEDCRLVVVVVVVFVFHKEKICNQKVHVCCSQPSLFLSLSSPLFAISLPFPHILRYATCIEYLIIIMMQ